MHRYGVGDLIRRMEIIDYFTSDRKDHWLGEILKSNWSAGKYLYELLRDHRLNRFCFAIYFMVK